MSQVVADHVRSLREHFVATGEAHSYFEINNGQCEDFALDLRKRLEADSIDSMDVENGNFMQGEDGDKDQNDVWDWELLLEHWGIDAPAGFTRDQINAIDFGNHVWLAVDKRHYDSECPEGVDSFFDLPLFRRYLVTDLRKRGIPAAEVVTDDVVPAPLCPVANPT